MTYTHKSSPVVLVAMILLVALFVFFIYTFFHELGHAVVGLLFRQTVTEFDLTFWDLSAHVRMVGELTKAQLTLQSAAGLTLPLLIWTGFISLVPRRSNLVLESLKIISSMAVINTLLPWIVLPILFLFGKAPSDDVTNFLRHSQIVPLLLTFLAALLYIGGWLLFVSKTDVRDVFHQFKSTDGRNILAGTRATFSSMAGVIAVCAMVTFLFAGWSGQNPANRFAPPQGFIPVTEIDLSQQPHSSDVLVQFTLDKPSYAGVFVVIRDINTSYFDLSVKGTDGYASTVLHGEGYNAAQDGGLWEENLPAGTYQVVLTSHQSPGKVTIYIQNP